MQFYLVYSGPLSASGNSRKTNEIAKIRSQFHPQLEILWQKSAALQRLMATSIVPSNESGHIGFTESPIGQDWRQQDSIPLGWVSLIEPIRRGNSNFMPLIRKSLDLNCKLEILFLRQEDPGSLVLQGGDLDNRIKTLCDALTIPNDDMAERFPSNHALTHCLLESDALVSALDVDTDRLLRPQSESNKEVHLVIKVTVRVLSVGNWNLPLVG